MVVSVMRLLRVGAWVGAAAAIVVAALALSAVPFPGPGWQPDRLVPTLGPALAAAACLGAVTRGTALAEAGRTGLAALAFGLPILVGAGYLAWFAGWI